MPTNFLKAGLFALVLIITFIVWWEVYWRSQGFTVAYNDDEKIWAEKRKEIYGPANESTIIIGSSRIKFDLDIPTWEKLTGEKVIQLSMTGTSPRPLLHDLANDSNFKGKVIVDITEPLFFSRNTQRTEDKAINGIKFYKEASPAQRANSFLNLGLESRLVFLEEDKFSLNELLYGIPLPKRKGIFHPPLFPKEFEVADYHRQAFMTPMFVADTNLQRKQINAWIQLGALDKRPAIKGDSLLAVFKEIKTSVDKIRSRGGQVIFVRTPSSGGYWETEQVVYPRTEYWDALLTYTNAPGIHFIDYPETASFICPEWSHLSPKDAITYTHHLVRIVQEKGWVFPKKITGPSTAKN